MALNFLFQHPSFFHSSRSRSFPKCVDCHLVSTSYWNIQVSLQVMMYSINSLYLTCQENLSRSVDRRAFSQGSNFLGLTSHRLSSYSICNEKFFWLFLYRCLQSQQLSEWSYDNLSAQFHWFWLLFVVLKQRQVNLDVGHLWLRHSTDQVWWTAISLLYCQNNIFVIISKTMSFIKNVRNIICLS